MKRLTALSCLILSIAALASLFSGCLSGPPTAFPAAAPPQTFAALYPPVPDPGWFQPPDRKLKADPLPTSPVPHGVCFPGTIIANHDGDTLTFMVTTVYEVRLDRCYVPELDEPRGPEAGQALRELAVGKRGRLFIPFGRPGYFGDETSFNRVVGIVWRDGSQVDLSGEMIRDGWASPTDPKKKKPAAR